MRIIIIIGLLSLFSYGWSNDSTVQRQKLFIPKRQDGSSIAQKLAADHLVGNFKPSLEMKECTDFLLTPALLVQEIVSEDIVVTYPSE